MVQVTKPNAGKILKDYLESHGISQSFVAKKMGLKPSAFNAHINGYNKFNADFALGVSKVLGISPSIFLKESYSKSVD